MQPPLSDYVPFPQGWPLMVAQKSFRRENGNNVFTNDWALFDTMITASIDKESRKVLETVLSYLYKG